MRTSLFATVVTATMLTVSVPVHPAWGQAVADPGFSYVDVNNDGLYNPPDGDIGRSTGVDLDQLLATGYFHTQISQGDYVAPSSPASLVVLKKLSNRSGVTLVAGADLLVAASVSARNGDAGFYAGGNVAFARETKVSAGEYIRVQAGGDIILASKTSFRARSKQAGAIIVQSETAGIELAEKVKLTCGWLCDLSTNAGAGPITLGDGVSVRATRRGDVNILSADALVMNGCKVSADNVTLQSHSSAGAEGAAGAGGGLAIVLNSKVTTPKKHGTVRILAEGKGSLIDLTGTVVKAGESVELQADTVVGN